MFSQLEILPKILSIFQNPSKPFLRKTHLLTMDAIKISKIQAINKFKRQQLLNNFFLYSLTALTCCFFCSSPFCYPPLFSCMKVFLFVSLPQISSLFISSKFFFIVCNLIVIFLVGEFASYSSSTSNVYYDAYVTRRRRLRTLSLLEYEEEAKLERRYNHKGGNRITREITQGFIKNTIVYKFQREMSSLAPKSFEEKVMSTCGEERGWIAEKLDVDDKELDGEGFGLPVEELNKRADDFIARIKKQRRLETALLICGSKGKR